MESEQAQRVPKKQLMGERLQAEMCPMEHSERRGKKTVTIIRETPCYLITDLEDKVFDYIEKCDK